MSQHQEAHILSELFHTLGISSDPWCVEFGAWDGQHLSNTYALWKTGGWNAVLIEGQPSRFKQLQANTEVFPKVHPLNAWVNFEGSNTLDELLKQTPIPTAFELLSIDVDGNDYHIWEALANYRPQVVVIEFNQSIPADIHFVQDRNLKTQQGNSLAAINELAKKKDYKLSAVTGCNAVFVRSDLFEKLNIQDNSITTLWKDAVKAPRIFQLYDGTLVTEPFSLYWTDQEVGPLDLQILSASKRTFNRKPSLLKRLIRKITS